MQVWQSAMPNFEFCNATHLNDAIKDYLQCYGLLACVERVDGNYFIGFREVAGFQILHQYFKQDDKQAETVLIVHGYTDHAGLFTKVIKQLLKKGKSVMVFDFPGHGLSSGERATIQSFDSYQKVFVECLHFFQSMVQQPIHLLAQSMGAAIVMHYLLIDWREEDKLVGKVILFAPLVRPAAWKQALWSHRFLSLVVSSIPRSYSNNSEDPLFLDFVRYQDPVQHDRLPTQWVGAMIGWVKTFEALAGNNFPVWIIQGDHDQTVDWQYNLEHLKIKFPCARICLVKGAGHHLAGESDRLQEKVFAFMDEAFAFNTD
jgi:alpha-beta hydrolase superfamily lysophospholipase